jgi:hypothetical protein
MLMESLHQWSLSEIQAFYLFSQTSALYVCSKMSSGLLLSSCLSNFQGTVSVLGLFYGVVFTRFIDARRID